VHVGEQARELVGSGRAAGAGGRLAGGDPQRDELVQQVQKAQ
jgi:hypothetical protein